ncbi:MAG: outer membrane protein transport protein [Muribaculaceae bacterium]|nr:outer membrane protein transport protein [Muribaculaceae bacterium]
MRKLFIAALAALLGSGAAMAEGYQVNTLSAKQLGMGHTGIALPLGGESMFFNPAGMGFMDKTLDVSAAITGIQPSCTATVDGKKYETDCAMSTPFNVNAAFSIYPNLKAGISIYTPYGSSINWTENWPGSVLSQEVNLKVFTIQPTVAWKPIENLSIGAGLMVSWGTVDLNKGLVTAATMDKAIGVLQQLQPELQGVPPFGDVTPASVNLKGTTRMAFGVNIGAQYRINDQWRVGASWRSQQMMKVKAGEASVKYANQAAQLVLGETLDLINQANFKAQMPACWVLGFGVAYKPIERLTIAADARLTGWHAYKKLDIEFLAEQLQAYNQNIEKRYKNSWTYSVGAQYEVTRRFDARLGLMIDTTPVNKEFYNPETPGMTKIEPTIGLSFRPVKGLSIDLAFMYIHGCGAKNTSCEYTDLLGATMIQKMSAIGLGNEAQKMFSPTATFRADYKLHAFAPSIGVSYSF